MRPTFRFRFVYILLLIALLIVGGALWYSNRLVQQLAQKEERLVRFWASSYQFLFSTLADPNNESLNPETSFLINKLIIQKSEDRPLSVPAIVLDEKGEIVTHSFADDSTRSPAEWKAYLQEELSDMRAYTPEPIVIRLPNHKQYLYYRETNELRALRRFPYLMLGVLGVFMTIVLGYVWVSQRSQQNKLWAGLAKETAHQLGTPISGLLAWTELLRQQPGQTEMLQTIATEMDYDLHHLQLIAERFSKVGSEPDLTPQPLAPLLLTAMSYVQTRLGQGTRVHFELKDELPAGTRALLNATLFQWVMENLLKNALDAMTGHQGAITVRARQRGHLLLIDVEDEGKGIPRRKQKTVFRPGYTTKKRGWGLGLSLARRIIQKFFGGKIYVLRSEPEKGTTFRIELRAIH